MSVNRIKLALAKLHLFETQMGRVEAYKLAVTGSGMSAVERRVLMDACHISPTEVGESEAHQGDEQALATTYELMLADLWVKVYIEVTKRPHLNKSPEQVSSLATDEANNAVDSFNKKFSQNLKNLAQDSDFNGED